MWKTQGGAALPANKLNMGIAAFGIAFRLVDPNTDIVGAPTSTVPPEEGCYTAQQGFWSYYETCLYRQGVAEKWIPSQSVPYAVTQGQWVGYDNTDSLDAKVAHIKSNGYGGVCVWAVDLDDYTGQFCRNGTNPFITYLKSIL
ncbi:acidic mammalian chitinase-like [Boleophthalmus pectinirostris]|uniref:acidic mammalian chitinase-like n=1 Tax=Boleophthalmus pectinirostris TaxID=150288 RepID=UPI00242EF48D|nr:acidic mammalian chitinase-like [Boleophthalmus pectinirostris]